MVFAWCFQLLSPYFVVQEYNEPERLLIVIGAYWRLFSYNGRIRVKLIIRTKYKRASYPVYIGNL